MSMIDVAELAPPPEEQSRSRVVLVGALAVLLVAIVVTLALSRGPQRALAELRVREQGVAVQAGEGQFVQAREGQSLPPGASVRTDETGQAQVDFFNDSLSRIDSASTVHLRELSTGPAVVGIEIDAGRIWSRVSELSGGERFEVRGGPATATVLGTSFLVDGRQAPTTWYYIGQSGETTVETGAGETFTLGEDDCLRVDDDEARTCSDHEFDALMDEWVLENQAYDEVPLHLDASPSPSVSPTPSPGPAVVRPSIERAPARPPQATAEPRATRTPRPPRTPDPAEEEEEETPPPETPDPTPPDPGDGDDDDPGP